MAAGGGHPRRGGRGGGGERTEQPVSPAELAGEKKSEPGAGVGGERGRSVGGGGGQGGHGVAVATVRRRDSWEGAVRPGAAGAERSEGREPGAGAGPARAPGCGTRPPAPLLASPRLSPAIPRTAALSGGRNSREE